MGIEGFIIDETFEKTESERPMYYRNEVIEKGEEFAIIRGFREAYYMSDKEVISRFGSKCRAVFTVGDVYDLNELGEGVVETLPMDFYLENARRFKAVRDELKDEYSKKSMDAYIFSKLTGEIDCLFPYITDTQYFFKNAPWKYNADDVLVDCGGFTGDSILDFVRLRRDAYKKIISLEPDEENYRILKGTVGSNGIKNVETYMIGAYKEKGVLRFSSAESVRGNEGFFATESGDVEIQVDSIDNIVGDDPVSIIKMDIEGSELDALIGATRTIKRMRSILMTCVYHKKDDIFKIFEFMDSICIDYVYFFRIHKVYAIDAVLYAVPQEKVRV